MSQNYGIGIDLGTTNSCVSIYREGKVEIIPNKHGNKTTPSYVAFTDKGRFVGDEAKEQAILEPENTIFDAKRLIGLKFMDKDVRNDMKNWPFQVIRSGQKPMIQINLKGNQRLYHPEEISSIILIELKRIADTHLDMDVKNCVITVPAYFNDSQRQATIDAGKIAGLNVMRIINEPTAAAIAYGFSKEKLGAKNVLIYDLGGGTFDVSILQINGPKIKVLSTGGNTHLGGEDFDNNLMNYAMKEFNEKYGIDVPYDKRALRRIRTACEKAKKELSIATQTKIDIDNLIPTKDNIPAEYGKDMYIVLTRDKFNEINEEHFNSTIHTIIDCLNQAKLKKDQIDEIVLVGGSSRIPQIRTIVKNFFSGKSLNKSINPDEAVARGAAINAALLLGDKSKEMQEVELYDVTPMSLGIDVRGDKMSTIIPRNTPVPKKFTKDYYTSSDNQTRIRITVLEGEKKMSKDNNVLGEFSIEGFPAKKKGEIKCEVTFDVNDNGILIVDCKETKTSIRESIKIKHDKGRLTDDVINKMAKENEKAHNEEKSRENARQQREKIYDYCADMIAEVQREYKNSIRSEINGIIEKCNKTTKWLDDNHDYPIAKYVEKYDEIKCFCENNLRYL